MKTGFTLFYILGINEAIYEAIRQKTRKKIGNSFDVRQSCLLLPSVNTKLEQGTQLTVFLEPKFLKTAICYSIPYKNICLFQKLEIVSVI